MTSFSLDRPVPWLDVPYIRSLVAGQGEEDRATVEALLARKCDELEKVKKGEVASEDGRGLTGIGLEEIAVLSAVRSPDLLEQLHTMAKEVKEHIYGNRVVTFAPLYYSNRCHNECDYCAFRVSNLEITRTSLTQEEIAQQTNLLIQQGHKRILMVAGESASKGQSGLDYAVETMKTIYATKDGKGEIRRVNANLAPLTVDGFKALREAGVGTYQCFQETYDPVVYKEHHILGAKADYVWRANVFDRALDAGLGDFGMGVLLGLGDWRFEVLALKSHINHLEELGSGAHTISFPRIEPAMGSSVSLKPPHEVSDEDFLKVISIMRLAVPYTGMIMSTRETPEMRRQTLACGISQVSAGSRTDPGGYDQSEDAAASGQFEVGDHRPLDVVVRELLTDGFIPSWCTACEQKGREGNTFIVYWAKTGKIKSQCTPNALVTLQEYLDDYASPETKRIGEAVIEKELSKMELPRRNVVSKLVQDTKNGTRGLCI